MVYSAGILNEPSPVTQDIWHHLQQLDCDIAQGYLIAKPLKAAEFEQRLHDQDWTCNISATGRSTRRSNTAI